MKKLSKFLTVSLALALAFGMNVSAASPDTQNTGIAASAQEQRAARANDSLSVPAGVTATIKAADDSQIYNVLQKATDPVVLSSLGVGIKDVVYVFDITADRNNVTMSFKVSGVRTDRSYALLHMNNDGTVKEILPAVCSVDGSITATFTSYSIYALIETDGNVATGTSVSPKTDESLPVAGIAAVIFLAGAFVCARKVRFQR